MDARLLDGRQPTGFHFSSDQQSKETDWDSLGPSLRLGHALFFHEEKYWAKNHGWHVEQTIWLLA